MHGSLFVGESRFCPSPSVSLSVSLPFPLPLFSARTSSPFVHPTGSVCKFVHVPVVVSPSWRDVRCGGPWSGSERVEWSGTLSREGCLSVCLSLSPCLFVCLVPLLLPLSLCVSVTVSLSLYVSTPVFGCRVCLLVSCLLCVSFCDRTRRTTVGPLLTDTRNSNPDT